MATVATPDKTAPERAAATNGHPAAKQPGIAALNAIVAEIGAVPGVSSMALCGSRARGTSTPKSDFDVMVFGRRPGGIDQSALEAAFTRLGCASAMNRKLSISELTLAGQKIELFFRTLSSVEEEYGRAQQGVFRRNFNPLHTLGFISTMMVSYIAYCRPIWDPNGDLRGLITRISAYPDPLRKRMLDIFGREAKLALIHAAKVGSGQDISYLSGLYARASAAMAMVLFAANRRYPMIDKDIHKLVARLPQSPPNYEERTSAIVRTAAGGDVVGARQIAAKLHKDVLQIVNAASQEASEGAGRPEG